MNTNNSDRLDDFLKKKLGNLEEVPSKENWKKIQTELGKEFKTPRSFWIETSVLVCFIGGTLFWLFNNNTVKTASNAYLDTVIKERTYQNKPTLNDLSKPTPLTEKEKNSKILLFRSQPSLEKNSVTKASLDIKNNSLSVKQLQSPTVYQNIALKNIIQKPDALNALLVSSTSNELLTPVALLTRTLSFQNETMDTPVAVANSGWVGKEEKQKPNEIHLGVHYKFKSIWIFNQNTYGQFKGSTMDYRADWGSDYGLLLGYDFKRKYGIQLEWNIKSVQGEKYQDVLRGKEYKREVYLEYTSFPILFKYKKSIRDNIVLNYLIGPQFATLKTAKITVNDVTSSAEDKFRRKELGIVLGMEGNFYLNKNLYFALGMRSGIGTDINSSKYPVTKKKPDKIFGDYDKSHNFVFGINASLNYYLKR